MLEAIVYVLFVGSNFAMKTLVIADYSTKDSFSTACIKASPDPMKPENRVNTIFGVNHYRGQFQFQDQLKIYNQQPPNTWYVADFKSGLI